MLETKVEMSIFDMEGCINCFKININILLKTVFENVEIEAGSSASGHQLQCTTWMLCLEHQQDEGSWETKSPVKSV